MLKRKWVMGIATGVFSFTVAAGAFDIQRGDLLDTDTIDVDWLQQFGDCPTQFPVKSINCNYQALNSKGIRATYIDLFNQHRHFTIENTFLLNISVNGEPISTCQMLQDKMAGNHVVTINRSNCVVG